MVKVDIISLYMFQHKDIITLLTFTQNQAQIVFDQQMVDVFFSVIETAVSDYFCIT